MRPSAPEQKLLDSFENVNREELGEVDATSLSNALEQLEVISTQQERMTFNKFKERELPGGPSSPSIPPFFHSAGG